MCSRSARATILLTAFADHRGPRVLARLDVSAGRQPQARLAVRDKQELPAQVVEDDEVAHQVRCWNIRPAHPVDRGLAGDPPHSGFEMAALQVVPRFDGADELHEVGTGLIVRGRDRAVC